MRWFVLKKTGETPTTITYQKASKYFTTKKQAQSEMKKRKKTHPKTFYKIAGSK